MYDVCVFSASRHCFTCVPYHMLVRLSISLDIRPYKEEPMPDADRPIKLKVEPDTQSPQGIHFQHSIMVSIFAFIRPCAYK